MKCGILVKKRGVGMKNDKKNFCILTTPFENGEGCGWEEYPRPQMKRESYQSLCGEWELFSSLSGRVEALGRITVPFAPESRLSGVFRNKSKEEKYIYKKTFTRGDTLSDERVILHFGAVDQIASVELNGRAVGEHIGGYLPFSFDVTGYLRDGENTLCVTVTDTLDTDLAYGKQRERRGGMWYTPVSGIWQAVWLESVPQRYIKELKISSTLHSVRVETAGGEREKRLTVYTDHGELCVSYEGDIVTLEIDEPRHWTPEEPYLYRFTLTDGRDCVESYFALRTVTVERRGEKPCICLNGKPYYLHGLLDQGYFPDGIYLPATPEGYRWDILTMKRLGFNMLRKHIKIEPELFYYYCDKYGMIVFQDMVNSGTYRYVRDTVLPTIGLKKTLPQRASERRRRFFESDCRETVGLLYNHPSVCLYTIFNEGWGQYEPDRIYRELRSIDPSRVWDATSGWFAGKDSDVQSEHIYFRKASMKPKGNKPLVLSEFGGYSYKVADHSYNPVDNYGYKSFDSPEALTEGISELYLSQIVPEIENKGLCATVLTQLSDVEDETNGMVTYDRRVVKVDEKVMRHISEKIWEAFEKTFR